MKRKPGQEDVSKRKAFIFNFYKGIFTKLICFRQKKKKKNMKRVYKQRNIKSRPLEIHIRSTSIECCCNLRSKLKHRQLKTSKLKHRYYFDSKSWFIPLSVVSFARYQYATCNTGSTARQLFCPLLISYPDLLCQLLRQQIWVRDQSPSLDSSVARN